MEVYLYSFFNPDVRRGGWSTPRTGRFTTENDQIPIVQKAGWAQGQSGRVQIISLTPGFDPLTVQPIASRYAD